MMKKLHILLMGATMVLASPAMAEETRELRSNNDNARPAAYAPQAGSINYADYIANDDDHGDDRPRTTATRQTSPQDQASSNSTTDR